MNLLFGFSGRMGRGGWWLGQLAIFAVLAVCLGMLMAVGKAGTLAESSPPGDLASAGGSVIAIMLAMIALVTWINIATTVKRFHDRDKSGAWFLITFVPFIGGIWILVECGMLPGTPGMNDYGPSDGPGGSAFGDGFLDMEDFGKSERTRAPAPVSTAAVVAAAPAPTGRRPVQGGFGRRGR